MNHIQSFHAKVFRIHLVGGAVVLSFKSLAISVPANSIIIEGESLHVTTVGKCGENEIMVVISEH